MSETPTVEKGVPLHTLATCEEGACDYCASFAGEVEGDA